MEKKYNMSVAKILLVEDEPVTAMAEASQLEKYDFQVETVHSGKDSLEYLKKNGNIDLILMDIELSDERDGIETARIIESKYELPILYLTSHRESKYFKRLNKTRSYNYILKDDVSGPMLNNAINQALKLHQAQQRLQQEKEQYKKLVNTAHEPMAIIKEEKLYLINKAFVNFTKYEKQELLGQPLKHIVDFSPIKNMLKELEEREKNIVEFEFEISSNSGSVCYLRARLNEIQIQMETAYILTLKDITDRKKLIDKIDRIENKKAENLIPICSSCKKIKENEQDKKVWLEPENYINKNWPDIEFTHSICPECKEELLEGHLNSTLKSDEED